MAKTTYSPADEGPGDDGLRAEYDALAESHAELVAALTKLLDHVEPHWKIPTLNHGGVQAIPDAIEALTKARQL